MKKFAYALIASPLVLLIALGLIFDTADMLIALAFLGLIILPMALGGYLLERFDR